MRVTNQSILANSTNRLQMNLQAMERAREQVSSGVRFTRMSEDPVAASEVVRVGSSMRAIEQFQRNIQRATAKIDTEERALNSLTTTLGRGLELAIAQASSTATTETRLSVKAEVDALIESVVQLGNTRLGDEYLFAGTRGGEAPFQNPPSTPGDFRALRDPLSNLVDPSGAIQIEIGDGRFITPNSNGTEVFLDTDALGSLYALSEALGNDDVPGVTAAVDALRDSASDVQTLIARQGARANDVMDADTRLGELELTLQTYRSDLRDTEIDKAMVELIGRQTLYQAAMSATSRVLGLSLANYL